MGTQWNHKDKLVPNGFEQLRATTGNDACRVLLKNAVSWASVSNVFSRVQASRPAWPSLKHYLLISSNGLVQGRVDIGERLKPLIKGRKLRKSCFYRITGARSEYGNAAPPVWKHTIGGLFDD
jgi:hypothetical protein